MDLMNFLSGWKTAFSSPKTKKTLLAIFGLALLVSVVPLLLVAVKWRLELRKLAVGELQDVAILSLHPSKTNIEVNDSVTVEVKLNTGGQNVYAVDLIIENSNPGALRLTKITPNTATNFRTFVPWVSETENFDEAGVRSEANNTGKIEFGAVAFDLQSADDPDYDPYGYPVNGNNILIATLEFRGIGEGTSTLSFEFNPADKSITTDSNVVAVIRPQEIVDDILNAAPSVSITVGETGECQWHSCGDADCDNNVDMNDFGIFVDEYTGGDVPGVDADFDGDGGVTMNDFGNFVDGYKCRGRCADAPHCS